MLREPPSTSPPGWSKCRHKRGSVFKNQTCSSGQPYAHTSFKSQHALQSQWLLCPVLLCHLPLSKANNKHKSPEAAKSRHKYYWELYFFKWLLLPAKLLESNCLPSEDTCLTCDVKANHKHTVASPLLAFLTRCHCTFLSFPPQRQNKAGTSSMKMSLWISSVFFISCPVSLHNMLLTFCCTSTCWLYY